MNSSPAASPFNARARDASRELAEAELRGDAPRYVQRPDVSVSVGTTSRLTRENLTFLDGLSRPSGPVTARVRTTTQPPRRSADSLRGQHQGQKRLTNRGSSDPGTAPRPSVDRPRRSTQAAPMRRSQESMRTHTSAGKLSTDSFSGSSDRGLTMDQLRHADDFGGVRTRSRAEVEIQRRKLNPTRMGHAETESAPGALLEEQLSIDTARRPSFPIEIVIHNQAGSSQPVHSNTGRHRPTDGHQGSTSSETSTDSNHLTRIWPGGPRVNLRTKTAQVILGMFKAMLLILFGSGGIVTVYAINRSLHSPSGASPAPSPS